MTAPKDRGENSVSGLTVDEAVVYSIENAKDATGRPLPVKHVAALANIPVSRVYEILQRKRHAWASEVGPITRASHQLVIADTIERDINRVGVALPVVGGTGDVAMGQAAKALIEFGEYMTTLGEAASDRKYTRDEARDLRAKAEQVVSAIFASVQQVEHEAGVMGLVKPMAVR